MDERYIPTAAEKKILETLSTPENYTISIIELCSKAGVSRSMYYEACKKPDFVKAKNEILNKLFDSLVPEVKRAAIKFAINNAANFQDRKMILEIAGEYRPQQDINVSEKISQADLEKELEQLEKMNKKK
jgi:hypothetical protein